MNTIDEKVQIQYDSIKEIINIAIEKGKFIAYGYGGSLFDDVRIKLEEEGYSVSEEQGQKDGFNTIIIKW